MMFDYDAYLFDWDGTICRGLEQWMQVYRQVYAEFGLPEVSDSDILRSMGGTEKVAPELGIAPKDMPDLLARLNAVSHALLPEAELYEDAPAALEHLKNQGKKLALITTSWRNTIEVLLHQHSLDDVFDLVVTGDEVQKIKPDPEGINLALQAFKTDKRRTVMMGDTTNDLGAAKNAGIDSILFYPPSHQLFYHLPSLKKLKPTHVIDGWSRLL